MSRGWTVLIAFVIVALVFVATGVAVFYLNGGSSPSSESKIVEPSPAAEAPASQLYAQEYRQTLEDNAILAEENAVLTAERAGLVRENSRLADDTAALVDAKETIVSLNERLAKLLSANKASRLRKIDRDAGGFDQEIEAESYAAIVNVHFVLTTTMADYMRIFGQPSPPGVDPHEPVHSVWDAFGTVADMGALGNKIIVSRHAFFGSIVINSKKNISLFQEFVIASITDQSLTRHPISLEGFMEFPELDLVLFKVPDSLQVAPLALAEVHPQFPAVVTQIYRDPSGYSLSRNETNWRTYSNQVQIRETSADFTPSWLGDVKQASSDNFVYVSGRILAGDSGGPLIINERGEDRIVAFVQAMAHSSDHVRTGIAVKASALRDKLVELESNPK